MSKFKNIGILLFLIVTSLNAEISLQHLEKAEKKAEEARLKFDAAKQELERAQKELQQVIGIEGIISKIYSLAQEVAKEISKPSNKEEEKFELEDSKGKKTTITYAYCPSHDETVIIWKRLIALLEKERFNFDFISFLTLEERRKLLNALRTYFVACFAALEKKGAYDELFRCVSVEPNFANLSHTDLELFNAIKPSIVLVTAIIDFMNYRIRIISNPVYKVLDRKLYSFHSTIDELRKLKKEKKHVPQSLSNKYNEALSLISLSLKLLLKDYPQAQ